VSFFINFKLFNLRIFLAHFQSRKVITIMIWIQSLNRKTSKLNIGTQIQFPRGKWWETKEGKWRQTRKLIHQKNHQNNIDPISTFFFKETRKMRKKCCNFYFLHFENNFLELITNPTFMQNLKKIASKMKARIPLENLYHLRGNVPNPLLIDCLAQIICTVEFQYFSAVFRTFAKHS